MSNLVKLLVLAVFLYVPTFVKADPLVVINFDDPPPAPLQTYQAQGVDLTTILIGSSGNVVGAINDITLRTTPDAVSPPQGAFPVAINPLSPVINGLSAFFVFTTQGVLVSGFTNFVSFNVIGSQGTWTVLFFDDTNRIFTDYVDLQKGLLATITADSDQVVTFTADRIGRFVFIPSQRNGTEGIDNLQFAPTSVPEPSTMVLLSLSIGGLLALKRRKSA